MKCEDFSSEIYEKHPKMTKTEKNKLMNLLEITHKILTKQKILNKLKKIYN